MDFKQWTLILGIPVSLCIALLGLFLMHREEQAAACTPLIWRRCAVCGVYEHSNEMHCTEHELPAPLVPITSCQLTRVTNAIFHRSINLPREACYAFGSFFLALEEHSQARWTAKEAYGIYKLASERYQEREVV